MKSKFYNNSFWAACLMPAFFTGAAFAQNKPADTLKSKNSGSLQVVVPQKLNEVVISVNRFEENSRKLPNQSFVIDKAKIAATNAPTAAELLQQSGAVNVQKSQLGGGSPVMRGFEANKVLLVVDGVRMNNAIYRGGHLQNVITLDNNMIDKVELIFGSSSVMYGSDALGGVIHFVTKKPSLSSTGATVLNGNAFTRYASASNEKTGHLNLNFGFKKWAALSSFTFSDFGDLRQGAVRDEKYADWGKRPFYQGSENGIDVKLKNENSLVQALSGYHQYDFQQKVLFQQNDRLNHVVNFQFSNSSNVNRYDRLTELKNGNLKHAQWYYGPQKRLFGSYALNYEANNRFFDKSRVTLAFQNVEESRHNRPFGGSTLENRFEKVNIYTLNTDLNKNLGVHKLNYGIEVNLNDVNSNAYGLNVNDNSRSKITTRYPDGGSAYNTYAAYLAHQWEINPKLILSDGVRFSKVDMDAKFVDNLMNLPFNSAEQHNNALSGNLGLVYLPTDSWKFSLLGSTGFRAPNVDDLAKVFETNSSQLIVPNPDLKPEYSYNVELGIRKSFGNRLTVDFTAFQTWLDNALTVGNYTLNGQSQVMYNNVLTDVKASVNARKAYINGVSAGMNARLMDQLTFSGNFNYTYGRIKNAEGTTPLDHIPPIFGKAGIAYNRDKFSSEFFVNYNGWKHLKDYNMEGEDNQQYATADGTPSWYTLNLRASYQVHKNIQFQAALENIMDRHYRVFASGISSPGRNLLLTIRGSF